MTALVARVVKRTFSPASGCVVAHPLPQPHEAESEERAKFGAALGGRHPGGGKRVRTFHVVVAVIGGAVTDQKPPDGCRWDSPMSEREKIYWALLKTSPDWC